MIHADDPRERQNCFDGTMPLHVASRFGLSPWAMTLIQKGLDVDA
jgi:hypothetical protein